MLNHSMQKMRIFGCGLNEKMILKIVLLNFFQHYMYSQILAIRY